MQNAPLGNDLGDHAGTDGLTTLTNREVLLVFERYWRYELNLELSSVTRHHHFNALNERNLTGNVGGADVELWLVTSGECIVTSTFIL